MTREMSKLARWTLLPVTGAVGGSVVCFVLMTLAFSVSPSGLSDAPWSMHLPVDADWDMIITISVTFGAGSGVLLAPLGYVLMRGELSFSRMVALSLAATLIPGAMGAFNGPAAAGMVALGSFVMFALVVHLFVTGRTGKTGGL